MVTREMPSVEAVAAIPPERPRMTYEEFLAWADEDVHAEWVEGEVIVHMTATPLHQKIISFLDRLMGMFVEFFELGELLFAPLQVKLGPGKPGREPDIVFVSETHRDRVTPERLTGLVDLAIEVVSDDSVSRDLDDKFIEYQDAGIPEYWIIDPRPRRKRALFYQADEDGLYQLVPVGKDGVYRSKAIPGFWLKVDWLWAEELPDPVLTFAEIVGLAPEVVEALEKMKQKAGG